MSPERRLRLVHQPRDRHYHSSDHRKDPVKHALGQQLFTAPSRFGYPASASRCRHLICTDICRFHTMDDANPGLKPLDASRRGRGKWRFANRLPQFRRGPDANSECSPTFEFEPERHKVVAGFDGGIITSDAGGLLLGRLDRGLGLIRRMACCFTDRRDPRLLEHTVETLAASACSPSRSAYEDLDHDELRHDPLFHCWPASSRSSVRTVAAWPESTLNRLEHRPTRGREGSITMRSSLGSIAWTSILVATSDAPS